ncbi:hypothetical protein ABK040_006915 [Willaertia magna]
MLISSEFQSELDTFLVTILEDTGYRGVEVRPSTPNKTEVIISVIRPVLALGEKAKRLKELTSIIEKRWGFKKNELELYVCKFTEKKKKEEKEVAPVCEEWTFEEAPVEESWGDAPTEETKIESAWEIEETTIEGLLKREGDLEGHYDAVTCLVIHPTNPNTLISGSKDKSILIWEITKDSNNSINNAEVKQTCLGHYGQISDISISVNGDYIISGSLDASIKKWSIDSGRVVKNFSNDSEITSVSIDVNNEVIASGSRNGTIKLWDSSSGECLFTSGYKNSHSGAVSCLRFSPAPESKLLVSCSHDGTTKVWNLSSKSKLSFECNLINYFTKELNGLCISPDGSLLSQGGNQENFSVYDLTTKGFLYNWFEKEKINALCYSPIRYWLCYATEKFIKIFDLESKKIIAKVRPEEDELIGKKVDKLECLSLTFSNDSTLLFGAYNDGVIRVWSVDLNCPHIF